jgi:hypothetical protein
MLKIFAIVAIGAAIVLFAAIVGMLLVYSSEQPQPYNPKEPSAAEGSNRKSGNISATQNGREKNNQKRQQKREWYYDFAERPTEWLLVLFNGLLVLATVTLFISGERSVTAARKSANAAQQSADVGKTALVATQRAFVFVDSFDANVINNELWIMPQWKNSGTTPANPVTNYVNWKTLNGPLPGDFSYPDLDTNGHPLPTKGQSPRSILGRRQRAMRRSFGFQFLSLSKSELDNFDFSFGGGLNIQTPS